MNNALQPGPNRTIPELDDQQFAEALEQAAQAVAKRFGRDVVVHVTPNDAGGSEGQRPKSKAMFDPLSPSGTNAFTGTPTGPAFAGTHRMGVENCKGIGAEYSIDSQFAASSRGVTISCDNTIHVAGFASIIDLVEAQKILPNGGLRPLQLPRMVRVGRKRQSAFRPTAPELLRKCLFQPS